MIYHRFYNKKNPMSDWGHAMFSDKEFSVEHYGKYHFTYNGKNSINIKDLKYVIEKAWKQCQEKDYFEPLDDEYYESLTPNEVYESFNPKDIVDSADGWDSDLVIWFWEYIGEPNDIDAVITNDGCIVFNEELIKMDKKPA